MVTTQPIHPTLADVRHMPISEVIALPVEHLATLHAEACDASVAAKRMADWIDAALSLRCRRIAQQQQQHRRNQATRGDAASPRAA